MLTERPAKGADDAPQDQAVQPLDPHFPSQDPKLVKETVLVSHFSLQRVRELVEASPALAKAARDWGFGDWETALGAASHTGSREIAELLIAHGARPDIFTFAMMGQLQVVKAYIEANPGIQRTSGPHGITLMSHAKKGKERALQVVEYLERIGDADLEPRSLPLSDREKEVYIGLYSFGPGADNRIEVAVGKDGLLNLKRGAASFSRRLFYLGNNQFHPTGARAVRIQFDVEKGRASALTVSDPNPILSARRQVS